MLLTAFEYPPEVVKVVHHQLGWQADNKKITIPTLYAVVSHARLQVHRGSLRLKVLHSAKQSKLV